MSHTEIEKQDMNWEDGEQQAAYGLTENSFYFKKEGRTLSPLSSFPSLISLHVLPLFLSPVTSLPSVLGTIELAWEQLPIKPALFYFKKTKIK